jgi:hypothetical protein
MYAFPAPVLRMDSNAMPFHYLPVPPDIAEEVISGGERRVIVRVNGVELRRYLFQSRNVEYAVIVSLSALRDMGLSQGDMADVDLEVDPEPDRIDICEEFRIAMDQDAEAAQRFDALSIGQRRGLAGYISSAKREETRIRRSLDICRKLRTHTLYGDRNE